jgi:RNA polymerase sigma factor (sigma-70 family)
MVRLYRQSGDLVVLGRLFSPYAALVYGVCLKYLKNREDARDAVMQVFEKLVDSLRQHDVEHFRGWLYVLARNHCLMQLRAAKGKFHEDVSDHGMENILTLHPDDEPELEQNLSKLEKCLATLATEQQQCVKMFFLEDKCYKDISESTGFELNKVKSHIQNGKRNLKICMEQHG